jgi:methionyl-tRNA synthetase
MSGGLGLPKSVLVHGFVTNKGEKMSKSLGNVVDPVLILDKYGVDPVRYYLMKEVSTFQDGDFSEKVLRETINNELVGNLGNFVNRTLTFIFAKFDGKVERQKLEEKDEAFIKEVYGLVDEITNLLEHNQLNVAALRILEISNLGNRYFQNNEPWKLIKENPAAAKRILYVCANACATLGILIYPYMPSSSEKLLGYLNRKPSALSDAKRIIEKFEIAKPDILFDRIE